jgi:hypothetical protein
MRHSSSQRAPRTRTCNTTQRCKPAPTCQLRNHHVHLRVARWPPGSRARTRRRPSGVRPSDPGTGRPTFKKARWPRLSLHPQPAWRRTPRTGNTAHYGLTVNVPAECLSTAGSMVPNKTAHSGQLLVLHRTPLKPFFLPDVTAAGVGSHRSSCFGFITVSPFSPVKNHCCNNTHIVE